MLRIIHLVMHRHAKLRVHWIRHRLKSKELVKEIDALHSELKKLNLKAKELDAIMNN